MTSESTRLFNNSNSFTKERTMERAEAETETEGAGAATSGNTNRQQLIKRVIKFAIGCSSFIPMIVIGVRFECPAIPSMKAFLITFGVIIAILTILKLAVNYPPGDFDVKSKKKFKEEHPELDKVIQGINFLQLPVGIWGLVITLSNLDLYGSLCQTDDTEVCTTCASAILICATVFCGIFLAVLILVFVLIAKAIITGKLKKKDPEEEEETKSEIGEA
jgi:hypothetical protein